MRWSRLTPVIAVAILVLAVIVIKTEQSGGISTDALALLLITFIALFIYIILSSPNDENLTYIQQTSISSDTPENPVQSDKSSLPDPLEEGFDLPL